MFKYKKQALRSVLLQILTVKANDKCTFLANIMQTYHNSCKKFCRESFSPFFQLKVSEITLRLCMEKINFPMKYKICSFVKRVSAILSVTSIISVLTCHELFSWFRFSIYFSHTHT